MTKTIVFDLDGTLISCRPRQITALRAVSGLSGEALSKIWQAKREGISTRDALIQIGISSDKAEEIVDRWSKVIESPYFLSYDSLLPGAAEALYECRNLGFRSVILTARKSLRGLLVQSNALHLNNMSDKIIAVDPLDASANKAIELQRHAALALIGDSEVDARAATSANISFFAVSSGQRSPNFLCQTIGQLPFSGVLPATLAALKSTVTKL